MSSKKLRTLRILSGFNLRLLATRPAIVGQSGACVLLMLLRLHKWLSANDALSHKMDTRNFLVVCGEKRFTRFSDSFTPAYASEESLIKKQKRKIKKLTQPTSNT